MNYELVLRAKRSPTVNSYNEGMANSTRQGLARRKHALNAVVRPVKSRSHPFTSFGARF